MRVKAKDRITESFSNDNIEYIKRSAEEQKMSQSVLVERLMLKGMECAEPIIIEKPKIITKVEEVEEPKVEMDHDDSSIMGMFLGM